MTKKHGDWNWKIISTEKLKMFYLFSNIDKWYEVFLRFIFTTGFLQKALNGFTIGNAFLVLQFFCRKELKIRQLKVFKWTMLLMRFIWIFSKRLIRHYSFMDIIDAHGLKIQGRGYGMFLPKFLGGQGFQKKLPGGSPYFVFYCIFINKFFKNLPGGGAVSSPLTPPLTPPCVHLCMDSI